jgi:hypothetical protein
MTNCIFWDITTCRPLKFNPCLAATCRLHLQVCLPPSFTLVSCLVYLWTRHFHPKRRLTCNGLHGFTFQEIQHFREFCSPSSLHPRFVQLSFTFSFRSTFVYILVSFNFRLHSRFVQLSFTFSFRSTFVYILVSLNFRLHSRFVQLSFTFSLRSTFVYILVSFNFRLHSRFVQLSFTFSFVQLSFTFSFRSTFVYILVYTGALQRLDWGMRWLSQHQTITAILLLYGFTSYSIWSTLALFDAAYSTTELI